MACEKSPKFPNSLNWKFGWKGMLNDGALNPPAPPCLSSARLWPEAKNILYESYYMLEI